MAKNPQLHPHADKQAFERLLVLIATLVQYPGVGWNADDESEAGHRDALQAVRLKLKEVAATCGIEFPSEYPAIRLRDSFASRHTSQRFGNFAALRHIR